MRKVSVLFGLGMVLVLVLTNTALAASPEVFPRSSHCPTASGRKASPAVVAPTFTSARSQMALSTRVICGQARAQS